MEIQEFKAILESIEVGLYDKWEANLMNPEIAGQRKSIQDYLDFQARDNYIDSAFYWKDANEGRNFWESINDCYLIVLAERRLI